MNKPINYAIRAAALQSVMHANGFNPYKAGTTWLLTRYDILKHLRLTSNTPAVV